jgi:membrane-associated phospholipid phosphatase
MHHLTDIGAAFLNGITCALLTFWWYRASSRHSPTPPAATNQSVGDLTR